MRRRNEDGERNAGAEARVWNARTRWPGHESRGAATACTRAAAIGAGAGDGRWVGSEEAPWEGEGRGDGSEGRRNGRGGGGAGVGQHQQERNGGVLWGFYGAFRRSVSGFGSEESEGSGNCVVGRSVLPGGSFHFSARSSTF
jgi:hypothetical protein